MAAGGGADLASPAWTDVRDVIEEIARERARQGFSPSETAIFVFSLKRPIFDRLRAEMAKDPAALADATWNVNLLLDKVGLWTTEVYQKGREEVIQAAAGGDAGALDAGGAALARRAGPAADRHAGQRADAGGHGEPPAAVVDTGAAIAIIDITGVPTVDTLVAQHLLKTVAAARLMGADCIISGIRPQIAQTIVHLGVELGDVTTKATLADAFAIALKRLGLAVCKAGS